MATTCIFMSVWNVIIFVWIAKIKITQTVLVAINLVNILFFIKIIALPVARVDIMQMIIMCVKVNIKIFYFCIIFKFSIKNVLLLAKSVYNINNVQVVKQN